MPTRILALLKDYGERSIVAVAVLSLFIGAFLLWVASVVTCITFLAAATVRVIGVTWRPRRAARTARYSPSPRNA